MYANACKMYTHFTKFHHRDSLYAQLIACNQGAAMFSFRPYFG